MTECFTVLVGTCCSSCTLFVNFVYNTLDVASPSCTPDPAASMYSTGMGLWSVASSLGSVLLILDRSLGNGDLSVAAGAILLAGVQVCVCVCAHRHVRQCMWHDCVGVAGL